VSRAEIVLFTSLILEAAEAGRLALGAHGVLLDGRYVDEQGGHEVIDFIDMGWLSESDGRITRGPGYVLEGATR
jgi:hypothetical protein